MKKFSDQDIFNCLSRITDLNTEHYKNDFEIDKEIFVKYSENATPQNPAYFLWLSRISGTQCSTEEKAYIKDTYTKNSWEYYYNSANDRIKAFAVKVTGEYDGQVIGDIYELDYKKHCEAIKPHYKNISSVTVTTEHAGNLDYDYKDYKQKEHEIRDNFGITHVDYQPDSEGKIELDNHLSEIRGKRERYSTEYDFDKYIAETFPQSMSIQEPQPQQKMKM